MSTTTRTTTRHWVVLGVSIVLLFVGVWQPPLVWSAAAAPTTTRQSPPQIRRQRTVFPSRRWLQQRVEQGHVEPVLQVKFANTSAAIVAALQPNHDHTENDHTQNDPTDVSGVWQSLANHVQGLLQPWCTEVRPAIPTPHHNPRVAALHAQYQFPQWFEYTCPGIDQGGGGGGGDEGRSAEPATMATTSTFDTMEEEEETASSFSSNTKKGQGVHDALLYLMRLEEQQLEQEQQQDQDQDDETRQRRQRQQRRHLHQGGLGDVHIELVEPRLEIIDAMYRGPIPPANHHTTNHKTRNQNQRRHQRRSQQPQREKEQAEKYPHVSTRDTLLPHNQQDRRNETTPTTTRRRHLNNINNAAYPNDPKYSPKLYGNTRLLHMDQAWQMLHDTNAWPNAQKVVIHVADSGADWRYHEDLGVNQWVNPDEKCDLEEGDKPKDQDKNQYKGDCHGYNFGDQSGGNLLGPNVHGTHVTGILAATTDNDVGVPGLAGGTREYPGVSIMTAVIFGNTSRPGNFEASMVYAADNGAHISSNSWHYSSQGNYPTLMQSAVHYAVHARGMVVVFAAGNKNTKDKYFPSAAHNVVAVGAVTNDQKKAWFSNSGPWVDIAAPGVDIYSTGLWNSDKPYLSASGTSMACPHVSAMLGLGKTLYPNATNTDLVSCMNRTATNLTHPSAQGLGHGLINPPAFLQCIQTEFLTPPPTVSAPPSESPSQTPTSQPSGSPSQLPTARPTDSLQPSTSPTSRPSVTPTTSTRPSLYPSWQPSSSPTVSPSTRPSSNPTATPTVSPSTRPSVIPTSVPSQSVAPSPVPSVSPSSHPSQLPSLVPSTAPSSIPSARPSRSSPPSSSPSSRPSTRPSTLQPSTTPSQQPSNRPTQVPTTMKARGMGGMRYLRVLGRRT